MRQRQSMGGMGLLILVVLLFMLLSMRGQGFSQEEEVSPQEFMMCLDEGTVESAVIRPNREVPTGEVEFVTAAGGTQTFNALDVMAIEQARCRRRTISFP